MNTDQLIVQYCKNRIVSYPYESKKVGRWMVARYRTFDKIPFVINCKEDIGVNIELMKRRVYHEHFGLYASNYNFKNTDMYYFDLPKPENIIDYVALIDMDHTRESLEIFKEIMSVLIYPKLPKKGHYMVVSGNGHHVKIVGFKSHQHASKYINDKFWIFNIDSKDLKRYLKKNKIDKYTYVLLTKMYECGMEIQLLNDVGRISTVPYTLYKYDKNILCIPFETKHFKDYQNGWSDVTNPRLADKLDLWNITPDESILEFNKQEIKEEISTVHRRFERGNAQIFDPDCFPDCVRNAVEYPLTDGRRRVIMFIATFLYSLGQNDDLIYEFCRQRDESFIDPLGEKVAEQIVSEVIKKGLACPKCAKVAGNDVSHNQYPYLSLGDFKLCKHIPNGSYCLKGRFNPVDVYVTLSKFFAKH